MLIVHFIIASLVIAAMGGFGVYAWYVSRTVIQANAIMDKPSIVSNAETLWQKIDAKLLGWKTIVLTWLAGVFGIFSQIPADTINTWTALPWANVVDQKIAAFIAIGLTFFASFTHAIGLKQAAQSNPAE